MSVTNEDAESRFRHAFEKLKRGESDILPKGTPVTQNNVAKEAGRDPSALRKSRYLGLIQEIQCWVEIHGMATVSRKRQHDNRNRTDKEKLADQRRQLDTLNSIINAQNKMIETLQVEIQQLRTGKISIFKMK